MSTRFLCDVSKVFDSSSSYVRIRYSFSTSYYNYYLHTAIIIPGSNVYYNDVQHGGLLGTNMVSYRVNKMNLRYDVSFINSASYNYDMPCYVVVFKVPRSSLEGLILTGSKNIGDFVLYKCPDNVLIYDVIKSRGNLSYQTVSYKERTLFINKPFVVGPSDFLVVQFLIRQNLVSDSCNVSSTAEVFYNTF